MPSRMLCNGTEQKSPEARSGLSLTPSRCISLHNIRDGIVFNALYAKTQYAHLNNYKQRYMAQSEQVAWRICKTWLEAQITLINLEQAKIEEVFLPYLVMPNNNTLFEEMQNNNFLLPSGE